MTDAHSRVEQIIDYRLERKFKKYALVFPNVPYTPSVEEPFVRVVHYQTSKVQASLGKDGWNRIDGTTSLYVSFPVGGKYRGTYEIHQTAGELVGLFERKTLTHDGVTVYMKRVRRVADTPYDDRFISLVELEWYAYVEKDTRKKPTDEGEGDSNDEG